MRRSSQRRDEGASTSSAHIHEESDEKAPIKGAVPEGESEPDAETKPESLTGEAPEVGSGATAAEEDEAQLAAAEPTADVLQVRKGMFGVEGSGDTSGYGGLTRVVEFRVRPARRSVAGGIRSMNGSVRWFPTSAT